MTLVGKARKKIKKIKIKVDGPSATRADYKSVSLPWAPCCAPRARSQLVQVVLQRGARQEQRLLAAATGGRKHKRNVDRQAGGLRCVGATEVTERSEQARRSKATQHGQAGQARKRQCSLDEPHGMGQLGLLILNAMTCRDKDTQASRAGRNGTC